LDKLKYEAKKPVQAIIKNKAEKAISPPVKPIKITNTAKITE
jgi:hypothetical protein